jgi:signal transduction histidine kinase
MHGDEYTGEMPVVVRTVWGLSLAALAFLFVRRPHTVLDVWLIVVLSAWLFDIALAAVINHGRYDFGFYAGRIYGLLAVSFVLFVLLSENTKLQARLLRLHEQAAAANRSKDLFLAMVGHELRNPLTSLKAAAHMLGRLTEADSRRAEARTLIDRQLANLSRLVEDLVDVGRAAQGRLSITMAPIDLADVARDVVGQYHASGKLQQHRLTTRWDAAPVHGDRQRLEQVIMNLLNNAVKYTPASRGIEVAVHAEGSDAVLSVCDEGVGMKPEVAARSFEWFYQANESLDRAQGGLGVGLALVKSLVQLHGGVVQTGPREKEGTCFTVRLPLREWRAE